ncbi:MAG: hypothetical protein KDA75_04310, partial [Planctomycetaceae bacterium]|nr:hypothetical protein [Planctomycetaceae bacterium]
MDRSSRWQLVLCAGLLLGGCAGNADKSSETGGEAASAPGGDHAPAPLLAPKRTAEAPRREARSTAGTAYTTIRVFYGTNRQATGDARPDRFFGTESGSLSFGFCDVSIPPNHEEGELE